MCRAPLYLSLVPGSRPLNRRRLLAQGWGHMMRSGEDICKNSMMSAEKEDRLDFSYLTDSDIRLMLRGTKLRGANLRIDYLP